MSSNNTKGEMKNQSEKGRDVRTTNISAAKAVSDVVRTSLGPRGMDKMIQDGKGEVKLDGLKTLGFADVIDFRSEFSGLFRLLILILLDS